MSHNSIRTLYVTPDISWPPRVGGEIRKWNVLQGLLQAGSADALVFRRTRNEIDPAAFAGCGRVISVDTGPFQLDARQREQYGSTLGRGWLALGSGLPLEYRGTGREEFLRWLGREVDLTSYDVIWFATARTAAPLGWQAGRAATVLDGDDFSYVREWHLLRSSPWYGAKVWNYADVAKLWWWERTHPGRFSYVVRCSQEDRDRHPSANVVVIPNGTGIPPLPERAPAAQVLFVGDLGYEPNSRGVEWFLKETWPHVRQRVPHAEFHIAGKRPNENIQKAQGSNGVVVHGFVEDLGVLYRTAAVSVVPLRAGGGTRLKILESLAHSVPVVSTHLGAFGIQADRDSGVERTDSPIEAAELCAQAILNPAAAQARANAGRAIVERVYDWKVIQRQVADLVHRAA